jgi:hypothetical protein
MISMLHFHFKHYLQTKTFKTCRNQRIVSEYLTWPSWHAPYKVFCFSSCNYCRRSRWPRDLKGRFAAGHLLGSRVRIPLEHGCSSLVFIVCCVGAINWSLVQMSSDVWVCGCVCVRACVRIHLCVCGVETSTVRRSGPELDCCATKKKHLLSKFLCWF